MNLLFDGIAWVLDPANWTGVGSIPERIGQHLAISAVVLAIASLIALPIGGLVGHTGRGKELAVMVSGGLRALPTLGLLTLFALWLGIGLQAPIVALVILALPPLLAGAYSGLESVDRRTVDAARSVGMREIQIIGKVELPLGMPIVVGGIRSATLQIIATATLAAYIADDGLGRFIFAGLKTRDYAEMLGGSILVILLALAVDGLFAITQRLVVPAGVRVTRTRELRSRPARPRAVVGRPITEGNRE
ncbi:glycine/betaine ABC transporter permease [Agromyces badenianii]|uniref:Glycine/betaine ABC transporter permease n=1 Tax=Agromyces badenianii TaxID=2080742 RepID=A0A2S0WVH2_9MICO|nr:ABC transporter permease [Agromyces badenianii]AWB95345.1 glycine/betaine ABC transporter permease [Agromyces badenianii]PWC04380.1 ABC transporter permease [Agromyces badenianii]